MGILAWFRRKSSSAQGDVAFEEVPISGEHDKLSDLECETRARKIRTLRDCPSDSAIENLLHLAQFDGRGELAVHAIMALATRSDRKRVRDAVNYAFVKAPPVCEAGYPPKPGQNVYPKTRLLYVLAWMKDAKLMKKLLDGSGSWPGAGKSKLLGYDLCCDVIRGVQTIVERVIHMEYLDEAGSPELMKMTLALYPELGLPPGAWETVSRKSKDVRGKVVALAVTGNSAVTETDIFRIIEREVNRSPQYRRAADAIEVVRIGLANVDPAAYAQHVAALYDTCMEAGGWKPVGNLHIFEYLEEPPIYVAFPIP